MDRPARWWRVAKCTERRCGRVEEGYTRSTFADVDDIDLRDPKIGNIHTCKWCEWLAEQPLQFKLLTGAPCPVRRLR